MPRFSALSLNYSRSLQNSAQKCRHKWLSAARRASWQWLPPLPRGKDKILVVFYLLLGYASLQLGETGGGWAGPASRGSRWAPRRRACLDRSGGSYLHTSGASFSIQLAAGLLVKEYFSRARGPQAGSGRGAPGFLQSPLPSSFPTFFSCFSVLGMRTAPILTIMETRKSLAGAEAQASGRPVQGDPVY